MRNEINNTVRTSEIVLCRDCKWFVHQEYKFNNVHFCKNEHGPIFLRDVTPTFGCVLGEPNTQSIGDEEVL